MKIHFLAAQPRRKPRTGDLRTTKAHGLQVRIPERVESGPNRGAYVTRSGRQGYVWVSPAEARRQGFGRYVPPDVPPGAGCRPMGYMHQRGAA